MLTATIGITFCLLAGCGETQPTTTPVRGKVVYRKQPVAGAIVTFYGAGSGMPASGETNAAGEFVLSSYGKDDGAIPGEHTICVTKTTVASAPVVTDLDSPDYAKAQAAANKTPSGSGLPAKYGDIRTTPLKERVEAGKTNEFEFELVD